jgi:hypothetical protein
MLSCCGLMWVNGQTGFVTSGCGQTGGCQVPLAARPDYFEAGGVRDAFGLWGMMRMRSGTLKARRKRSANCQSFAGRNTRKPPLRWDVDSLRN